MALLAQSVSAAGHPVFRYDRRGIGDSTGVNGGFQAARDDLIAAAAAFRANAPQLDRIVGFGNCDAASTLALFGRNAGIDRLLLANPWTIEQTDALPPAAAIRATYRQRLTDPALSLRSRPGATRRPSCSPAATPRTNGSCWPSMPAARWAWRTSAWRPS